jgi:hypothetical protein
MTTIKLQGKRIAIVRNDKTSFVNKSDITRLQKFDHAVASLETQIAGLTKKRDGVNKERGKFLVALAKKLDLTKEQVNQIVFFANGGRTNALAARVSKAWKAAGTKARNKGRGSKTAARKTAPRKTMSPTVRTTITKLARKLAKQFDLTVKAAYANGRFTLVLAA